MFFYNNSTTVYDIQSLFHYLPVNVSMYTSTHPSILTISRPAFCKNKKPTIFIFTICVAQSSFQGLQHFPLGGHINFHRAPFDRCPNLNGTVPWREHQTAEVRWVEDKEDASALTITPQASSFLLHQFIRLFLTLSITWLQNYTEVNGFIEQIFMKQFFKSLVLRHIFIKPPFSVSEHVFSGVDTFLILFCRLVC